MIVANVALGSVKKYDAYVMGLTEAPTGYHSVQGVKDPLKTPGKFTENEFVIFHPNQQYQAFLVEFHVGDEKNASKPVKHATLVEPTLMESGQLKATWGNTPAPSLASISASHNRSLSDLDRESSALTAASLLQTTKAASSYSSGMLEDTALKLQPTRLQVDTPVSLSPRSETGIKVSPRALSFPRLYSPKT